MKIIMAIKFKNISFAAPTIFEFEDDEGTQYQFRYRHGKYTFKSKLVNQDNYNLICEGQYGNEFDGYITADQFIQLMFTNHQIGIIIKSTFNEQTNVEAQITLYERMKSYEHFDTLDVEQPVILRLDGIAFHTFTKGLNKPFDNTLSNIFMMTCGQLLKNIQNAKFIYSQSDEISILLTSYEKEETQPWLGYRIQKMCSVASSLTTKYFNKYIQDVYTIYNQTNLKENIIRWSNKQFKACFDCRCFNLPKYEVSNYFIYRQLDAIRNSKASLGQAHYSQKELNGKSTQEVIQMLEKDKNIKWEDTQISQQRGFCVYRKNDNIATDITIPLFSENRQYIEQYL